MHNMNVCVFVCTYREESTEPERKKRRFASITHTAAVAAAAGGAAFDFCPLLADS